jgi:hypothetical protein
MIKTGAILLQQREFPARDRLPVCPGEPTDERAFQAWFRQRRPDALLVTHARPVRRWLEAAGRGKRGVTAARLVSRQPRTLHPRNARQGRGASSLARGRLVRARRLASVASAWRCRTPAIGMSARKCVPPLAASSSDQRVEPFGSTLPWESLDENIWVDDAVAVWSFKQPCAVAITDAAHR